jgi:hypothetical protein
MSEFKKENSLAAAIALVVALGIGYVAITAFPSGPGATATRTLGSSTTGTAIVTGTSPPYLIPKALLGYLSAQDVSCILSTGVCTFTIVNNSTVPLGLEGCSVQVTVSSVSTLTTGTIGGPATGGILANSSVGATCTVPTSQLGFSTVGSPVNGLFGVKLLANWFSYPAGDEVWFNFEGIWS